MTPICSVRARSRAHIRSWIRLEDRVTPAFGGVSLPHAVPALIEPRGLGYFADGDWIPLSIRGDEWAVRSADLDTELAAWTVRGGPLDGFDLLRRHGSDIAVLAAPPSADLDAVRSAISADWIAPVYTARSVADSWLVPAGEVIIALPSADVANDFFIGDARFSGFRPVWGTPDQFVATLADGHGHAVLTVASDLADDPAVRWASPNFYQSWQRFYSPNDPLFGLQWHLKNTGQYGGKVGADVNATAAWDVTQGGSSSILIAVVDDGMEYTHPDLAPNMMKNPGEIAGNGKDDDGNGYVDDVFGYDFTTNDGDPGPSTPSDEHATAVAGIAAAKGDNNLGVAGIAYNSQLTAVRIFEGFKVASDANIASAVYYAAGRNKSGSGQWRDVHIMNNSWGGGMPNTTLTDAFTWASNSARGGKGTVTFLASGNGGGIIYPATLAGTLPGLVAVGASSDGDVWTYSSSGPQLDFLAPSDGGNFGIVTTDRVGGNGYDAGDYTENGFSYFGGTSASSPLAAGVGALILSREPNLTAPQVRGLMRNTTDLIGNAAYDAQGFDLKYGYGRVNAFTAVQGVGVAKVQVLDGSVVIADGTGSVSRTGVLGTSTDVLIRVRNQGTLDLNLGSISLTPGPFTLLNPFGASTLPVGKSTTMAVRFTPTSVGSTTQTVSFATNDASAPLFDFQLQGIAVAKSVSGTVYEDSNGNGQLDPGDTRLAGQTVYLDLNNNGVFDSQIKTIPATNVPVPITDFTTSTSTIGVAGMVGQIADVDVQISITHTWVGDLKATLTGPNGKVVELFRYVGVDGDNFDNTIFDDEAPISITKGTAPFSGSFQPAEPLSAFDGIDANGTWTLTIRDDFGGDIGSLTAWSLKITTASEPNTITDAKGAYQFTGLAAGNYPVRLAAPGWNVLAPVGGVHNIVIAAAADQFPGRDFALVKANAIYGKIVHDLNGDGVLDANEPGLSGFRAYVDTNGNGKYDLAPPTTYKSANLGQVIDGKSVVISNLDVSGFSGAVADVEVKLTITHTWNGDLRVNLINPAGNKVLLFDNVGGDSDNFIDTVLNDAAAVSITEGKAPFTGTFRPMGKLSNFQGGPGNGTWKLQIEDTFAAADNGQLVAWSITLTPPSTEPSAISNSQGYYRIDDVAAGGHQLRRVLPASWVGTFPASGVHDVTLAAGQTLFGRDFGQVVTPLVVDLAIDENDGNTSKGDLSLREAILLANASPGLNLITFDPAVFGSPQTIKLTLGEMLITQPVVVVGPGKDLLTISGNNAGRIFKVFNASAKIDLTASGITFTQGKSVGGPHGGAIFADGEAVTISQSAFTSSTADASGGGVAVVGAALTITDTSFTANSAKAAGGAFAAFLPGSSLTVRRSVVTGNTAINAGGGVYTSGPSTVEDSIFANNTATRTDTFGVAGGMSFSNFYGPADVTVRNTTVSGNSSANGGGGIDLFSFAGTLTLEHVTVTNNTAKAGKGGGGLGAFSETGQVVVRNSILAGNTDLTGQNADVAIAKGTVSSQTSIFSQAPTASSFTDLGGTLIPPFADLKLGPLANHGGPTATHALLLGSPAVNAATPIVGIVTDQRGRPRPADGKPDIGAFEAQPLSITSVVINDGDVQRSRVTSIVVTFDQAVTTPPQPGDGFQLVRQGDDAVVGLSGSMVGSNAVRLTFAGTTAVESGSLADGRYTLTAFAGKLSGERPLDGDGDGLSGDNFVLVGTPANGLFRLFGDADGNGGVNFTDFLQFRGAFGGTGPNLPYDNAFDFDNDNTINFTDFLQFRTRFGTTI